MVYPSKKRSSGHNRRGRKRGRRALKQRSTSPPPENGGDGVVDNSESGNPVGSGESKSVRIISSPDKEDISVSSSATALGLVEMRSGLVKYEGLSMKDENTEVWRSGSEFSIDVESLASAGGSSVSSNSSWCDPTIEAVEPALFLTKEALESALFPTLEAVEPALLLTKDTPILLPCEVAADIILNPRNKAVDSTQLPVEETAVPTQLPVKEADVPTQLPAQRPVKEVTVTAQLPAKEPAVPTQLPAKEAAVPNQLPANKDAVPNQLPANKDAVPTQLPLKEVAVPTQLPLKEVAVPTKLPSNKAAISVQNNETAGQEQLPVKEAADEDQLPGKASADQDQPAVKEAADQYQLLIKGTADSSLLTTGEAAWVGKHYKELSKDGHPDNHSTSPAKSARRTDDGLELYRLPDKKPNIYPAVVVANGVFGNLDSCCTSKKVQTGKESPQLKSWLAMEDFFLYDMKKIQEAERKYFTLKVFLFSLILLTAWFFFI